MQTFLPFEDFTQSQLILDKRRLNKNVVETTQILNILLERTKSKGWASHPIVKIWRGYENALKVYKNKGMEIAESKGIKYVKLLREEVDPLGDITNPPLIGNTNFHLSHLANLKRKALEDAQKERLELQNNMIAILGEDEFNRIDESLPYIWSM